MTKTFMEEKLEIFEPFMGKEVKIKVTVVQDQGKFVSPAVVQIIVLAGRLIGVEVDVEKSKLNIVVDHMIQGVGSGEPLPLDFDETPHPLVEIEELFEDVVVLDGRQ